MELRSPNGVSELKFGEVLRVICRSTLRTELRIFIDKLVVVGEVIQFSDYENYNSDWTVIEVLGIADYSTCQKKWGKDSWFLRKISL